MLLDSSFLKICLLLPLPPCLSDWSMIATAIVVYLLW